MLLCLRIWVYVYTGQNIYPSQWQILYTPGYDHIWCFYLISKFVFK